MFYNHYAYKVEFSVRKGNETKKNRVIHWKKKILFVLGNEKQMRHGGKKKKRKKRRSVHLKKENERIFKHIAKQNQLLVMMGQIMWS